MTLLDAIARMEGWLDPHSLCRRNNNPGNIEWGKFAIAHGGRRAPDGRFAEFPSAAMGFEAMRALLSGPAYAGLTVEDAIAKWAPPQENNTARYITLVCQWAGARPHDALASKLAALPATLQQV